MAQRIKAYPFSASTLRASLEWLSFACLLLLFSIISQPNMPWEEALGDAATIIILAITGFAIRLRLSQEVWYFKLLHEWGKGLGAVLAFNVLIFFLFTTLAPLEVSREQDNPVLLLSAVSGLMIILTGFQYAQIRLSLYLLRYWQRLRQKHLMWAITHWHIMLIALLITLLSLSVFFSINLLTGESLVAFLKTLPNILAITLTLFFGILLFLLMPLALLSYFISHQITQRLAGLTAATEAMQKGEYATRTAITGEDEIAQLQHNFNGMAEKLEMTISELKQERDRVATLQKAQHDLLINISHDLRTPLATLLSRFHAHEIEGEILQIKHLVDDIFATAYHDIGHLLLSPKPTDVCPLLHRLAEQMTPLAWERNRIQISVDTPENLPHIQIDVIRLEQILSNLILNAIKHTPPGGLILLIAQAQDNTVSLSVQDTGDGISPDELPHIWERFYRTSSSQHLSGTGFGLAIVKSLTEAMGGQIMVSSERHEGTCFRLIFPVR